METGVPSMLVEPARGLLPRAAGRTDYDFTNLRTYFCATSPNLLGHKVDQTDLMSDGGRSCLLLLPGRRFRPKM